MSCIKNNNNITSGLPLQQCHLLSLSSNNTSRRQLGLVLVIQLCCADRHLLRLWLLGRSTRIQTKLTDVSRVFAVLLCISNKESISAVLDA